MAIVVWGEVEGICSASSSNFFRFLSARFSTYPSLSFLCNSHYHLISSLIDNAFCKERHFLVIHFGLISVFLTSLSVWYWFHSFLFCRQDFLNFLWEILFILYSKLYSNLKRIIRFHEELHCNVFFTMLKVLLSPLTGVATLFRW